MFNFLGIEVHYGTIIDDRIPIKYYLELKVLKIQGNKIAAKLVTFELLNIASTVYKGCRLPSHMNFYLRSETNLQPWQSLWAFGRWDRASPRRGGPTEHSPPRHSSLGSSRRPFHPWDSYPSTQALGLKGREACPLLQEEDPWKEGKWKEQKRPWRTKPNQTSMEDFPKPRLFKWWRVKRLWSVHSGMEKEPIRHCKWGMRPPLFSHCVSRYPFRSWRRAPSASRRVPRSGAHRRVASEDGCWAPHVWIWNAELNMVILLISQRVSCPRTWMLLGERRSQPKRWSWRVPSGGSWPCRRFSRDAEIPSGCGGHDGTGEIWEGTECCRREEPNLTNGRRRLALNFSGTPPESLTHYLDPAASRKSSRPLAFSVGPTGPRQRGGRLRQEKIGPRASPTRSQPCSMRWEPTLHQSGITATDPICPPLWLIPIS